MIDASVGVKVTNQAGFIWDYPAHKQSGGRAAALRHRIARALIITLPVMWIIPDLFGLCIQGSDWRECSGTGILPVRWSGWRDYFGNAQQDACATIARRSTSNFRQRHNSFDAIIDVTLRDEFRPFHKADSAKPLIDAG
jgi:hypothetical protein